ncbi:MAG TPA: hypothetical protein VFJ74_10540, partial [Gemmatimonadaceae bacterium]|nr:hypothetical protein [Gemmatimonadaceae bacterium]
MSAVATGVSVRDELRRFAPETTEANAPLAAFVSDEPPAVPYRGISTFRFVDAPILFARDADVYRLAQSVTVYRGTLLYGESGVGKSSLINAGFLPAALVLGFRPERLRVQPRAGAEIVVERVSRNSDGKAPFLQSALVDDDANERATLSTQEFVRRVRGLAPAQRALFILDQFEEVVTLFEDVPTEGDAAAEALALQTALLDGIAELLRDHAVPVKLLFSFREDYLARLTKLFDRVPDLADHAVRLTPPACDDLEAIVGGPLSRFPEAYGGRFTPELQQTLVAAFRERFRTGPVVLTEVQIACRKLWTADGDPAAALARAGGIQGLLESYVTDARDEFEPPDRPVIDAILMRLVTKNGTRNIVSREDLRHAVADECGVSPEHVGDLLDALDGKQVRLVRSEERQRMVYYTIVSEFLVPWIRQLKEQRVREEAERKLAAEREAAQARLREEQRQAQARLASEREAAERQYAELRARRARQRLYWASIALVVLAAGMVATSLLYRRARASERRATQLTFALRDTNTMFLNLKDSVEVVAHQQADSLLRMNAARARDIAHADSLKLMAGSSHDQLKAALDARAQAQLALERAQAENLALRRSLGSTYGANQVVQRSADSSASKLQQQLQYETQARTAAQAEAARLRNEQAQLALWVDKMRHDPDGRTQSFVQQLCSIAPRSCVYP